MITSHHFYEYFWITPEGFDSFLSLVRPLLSKKSLYREPISPGESVAVILRFLATGDSLQAISFGHRLGHTDVSRIPAACNALWVNTKPTHRRQFQTKWHPHGRGVS